MSSRTTLSGRLAILGGVLWLVPVAAAASPDIPAWNWQDRPADSTVDVATADAGDRNQDGDGRLDDHLQFTASQAFYGDATANATASIDIRSDGADRPGAAATAAAVGNYLSFESDQITSLAVTQQHEASPAATSSGRASVTATAAVAMTGDDGEPITGTGAVRMDVTAISNLLSVNLASQDENAEFVIAVDQRSDADVAASAETSDGTVSMTASSGIAPTGAPSPGTGVNPGGGGAVTAITNYTSLRFDSSSTSQDQ